MFLQGGGVKRKKNSFSPAPWKKRKFENKQRSDDRPTKTSDNKQKFSKKDRTDYKSNKQTRGEKEKGKNSGKDRETKGKKGKIAGMTIQQRLKLKKKRKLKLKEKKIPKHKRKLLT